ncbi:hypothetical protein [Heliomicrobium gestii]|nr:hypothetical protein [Heliomicrobium gestii]MBM7865522.1 hypothetical protein [Heliomicrobium gestii]
MQNNSEVWRDQRSSGASRRAALSERANPPRLQRLGLPENVQ